MPMTVAIQGSLRNQSGGPVADGHDDITLSLYAEKDAKKAVSSDLG